MAILEKEVWVGVANKTIKHYEDKGYEIPRYINKQGRLTVKKGTEILVKIEDLSEGSNVKVTRICDECGNKKSNIMYAKIIQCRKDGNGKDRCINCMRKKVEYEKRLNIKYEDSLEYWAKENDKEYLLEEFSMKNVLTPDKIYKSSNDKYWWNCKKCGGEYDMTMNQRTNKNTNCPYCAGKRVLKGYNDLWTTHPHVADMLVNKDNGYKITSGSGKKENFSCVNCGHSENKIIQKVVDRGFSCSKCSDGVSYPEKFMFNILSQLNVKFIKSKTFEWSKNKIYDFYIPSVNTIIETHGIQHYRYTGLPNTLEEEQENDRLKEELAKENGIDKYIVIDCRHSEMGWIKTNIINCELNKLCDFSKVDWLECHKYATSSLVKIASEYWNKGIESTIKIGKIIGIAPANVSRYLKQGSELGWCNYDVKEVRRRIGKTNGKNGTKPIVQLSLDGMFIKQWESNIKAANELKINRSAISNACNGKLKSAGKFMWMHKEDYDIKKGNIKPYVNNQKSIIQLSFDGEFIKEWSSLTQACDILNLSKSGITGVLIGKIKSVGGYLWMYKDEYEKNKNKLIHYKPRSFRRNIVKLDLNRNFLEEYKSISEAIRINGGQHNKITLVCKGEIESYKGFKWMYKEDYEKMINNQQKEKCLV